MVAKGRCLTSEFGLEKKPISHRELQVKTVCMALNISGQLVLFGQKGEPCQWEKKPARPLSSQEGRMVKKLGVFSP